MYTTFDVQNAFVHVHTLTKNIKCYKSIVNLHELNTVYNYVSVFAFTGSTFESFNVIAIQKHIQVML